MAKKKENILDSNVNDININVGVGDTGDSMAAGTFEIRENAADIGITVKDEKTAEVLTAATKMLKKVSLEQLIKKKLEKDGRRNATKEIYVKSLDGNITVNNPSDTQRIVFNDKNKSGSYVDMMDAFVNLIYDCCPIFHSKELQNSIEVDYPYDTIRAILDIDEISEIGLKVLNFFDDEEENDADEKLKNS